MVLNMSILLPLHLHWLPLHSRIQYKIALLTYENCESLLTNYQPYLRNILHISIITSSSLSQSEFFMYYFVGK